MKKLSFLLSACLLSACSTLTPPTATQLQQPTTKIAISDPAALRAWTLRGAIGIHTATEGTNASVYWQQQGQHYALQIYGPLGMYRLQLTGTPQQVTLQREGQTYHAANAETLLQQQVGWVLPVTNLVYWVRGIPAPGVGAQTLRDSQHRLTQLVQQGWQIRYLDYTVIDNLSLPKKIELTQQQLQIRFVIQQWTI